MIHSARYLDGRRNLCTVGSWRRIQKMVPHAIFIGLLLMAPFALAANILAIVPMPFKSHTILFETLTQSLAKKGHNVTYISAFPQKKTTPNLNQIILPAKGEESLKKQNINLFTMRYQTLLTYILKLPSFGLMTCEDQLSTQEMKTLLASESQFDLVISQAFLTESIMAGLSYRFQAPLIAYTTFQSTIWSNYLVGNMAPTSFIPDPFTGYSQQMTFFQRLNNLVVQTIASINHFRTYIPKQDEIFHKHFGRDAPPILEVLKNTSLLFTNDHYSLTYPRPLVPNIIPIGGVHVPPLKPVEGEYLQHLNKAKRGAILFSLGSNLKSSQMPPEKIQIFLDVFSKLKLTVLWKFEADLPKKPVNVIISNWMPQTDILGHENVKLFITHGGLLSTTESVVRGVPVLGIPIFGDQKMNMKIAENSGMGLTTDYDTLTVDGLYNTIIELLENPKYRQAARMRSQLLRDQPLTQLETAMFWIEHVLRHKGAPHLRSPVVDLTWYQAYQVDVVVFATVIVIMSLYVLLATLRLILHKILVKTSMAPVSVKKQN